MKYLRLLYVSFLLSFVFTGCQKKREPVIPPPQAQIPIITTMPPLPAAGLSPVVLGVAKPAAPVVAAAPPPEPAKKSIRHRRHRAASKSGTASDSASAATPNGDNTAMAAAGTEGGGASPIGQLSAEDTDVNPKQTEQVRLLIESTRKRVKHLSSSEQAARKNDIAAINAFLARAKQALNSNDLVGAETLAKKAKILLDELLK